MTFGQLCLGAILTLTTVTDKRITLTKDDTKKDTSHL